jgi:hypothetical protein
LSTNLRSVCLSVDVDFIAVNAFPDYCEISREWDTGVIDLMSIGFECGGKEQATREVRNERKGK